jgi:ABC-type Mn2+/Zn2+ transport system permease subunit
VIDSFLASWPLFHDVYISGALIAMLLSLVGIAVVARDQIFLGAAVSQASLLGIAVGIWIDGMTIGTAWEWMASDTTHSVMGGVFAVTGSLAVAAASSKLRETREALTGWLFLAGSSLSVLIVANSPHGMAEVNRLLSSTIIGAGDFDVAIFVTLLAVTVAVLALRLRPLMLLLTDAQTAQALGIAVARWDHALAVWLGLSVAWSIHVSGMIFTFGCLVLPGLIAKSLVREVRSLFFVAPLVALVTAVVAFVVANDRDLPPGQVTVALLCAVQVVAWSVRNRRSMH